MSWGVAPSYDYSGLQPDKEYSELLIGILAKNKKSDIQP